MAKIIIDGLIGSDNVVTAIRCGADGITVHVPSSQESTLRHKVSPAQALSTCEAVPTFSTSVLVTDSRNNNFIVQKAKELGTRSVQLVYPIPSKRVAHLKGLYPTLQVIPTLHAWHGEEEITTAQKLAPHASAFVLQLCDGSRRSSSGAAWQLAKRVRQVTDVPVIISGGLTHENVAEAIREAEPYAVMIDRQTVYAHGEFVPQLILDLTHFVRYARRQAGA